MGHVRLTQRRRALLGYAAGCALVVAGVWWAFDFGFALIVSGVVVAASFLLLADVGEGVSEPPAVPAAQRIHDPTL